MTKVTCRFVKKPDDDSMRNRAKGAPVPRQWRHFIGYKVGTKQMTALEAERKYGVDRKSVRNYARNFINGREYLDKGRPPALDETSRKAVQEVVQNASFSNKTIPLNSSKQHDREDLKTIINNEANNTKNRRGSYKCNSDMNIPSIKHQINKLGLKITTSQNTTGSRADATQSPYMAASTFILFSIISALSVHPRLCMNMDMTRCETSLMAQMKSGRKGEQCVVSKDQKFISPGSSTQTSNGIEHKGVIGVRWFPVMNAYGDLGPVVLILSDDSMKEGDFETHKVEGLVNNNNNGGNYDFGYVVVLKTTPRESFMSWFFKTVVLDFMNRIRVKFQLRDRPGFLLHDGEHCQINPWVKEETDLMEKFKEGNIYVGKLGPSTTGVSQPLDAGKIFCNVHQEVNKQYLDGPHMKNNTDCVWMMEQVLKKHLEKYPNTKLKGDKTRLAKSALVGVFVAVKRCATNDAGEKSFLEAGLYIDDDVLLANPDQVLRKYNLSARIYSDEAVAHEKHALISKFPEQCESLLDRFLTMKELTDQEIANAVDMVLRLDDIVDDKDRNRHTRHTNQKRCVLLFTPEVSPRIQVMRKKEEAREEKKRVRKQEETEKLTNEVTKKAKEIEKLKTQLCIEREKHGKAIEREKDTKEKLMNIIASLKDQIVELRKKNATSKKSSNASSSSMRGGDNSSSFSTLTGHQSEAPEISAAGRVGQNRGSEQHKVKVMDK